MPKNRLILVLLMLVLAAFVGCSSDDDTTTNPPVDSSWDVLSAAVTDMLNDSAATPGGISADALAMDLATYTVIDIRSQSVFDAGHIPGAYHSGLGTLLDDVGNTIPVNKPFVVACYSGQSAGHAVVALKLMGHEAKTLLFGMSSWNSALSSSWDDNTANELAVAETTNNNGDLVVNAFPTAVDGYNAATVVADRVAVMLNNGFKGINYSDMVLNGLENYFIVNYFGEADYLGTGTAGVPGHIPGAYQFTPNQSLGVDQMLNNLPTDMPIVVYCWTGQHSSQVAAALNILGYEALSLKFGSNRLFHDQLTAHAWNGTTAAYTLETTSGVQPEFQALATAVEVIMNDSAVTAGGITADALALALADYTVIDIRSQSVYDAGHIPGAYHSSLGTILDDVGDTIPTDKPFVVACYTGQSAGHAVVALKMMGYETKTLLFGMCSWNSTLSTGWDDNTGDALAVPETTNNNGDLTTHDFPTLGYDLATVVDDAVDDMLAGGFKGIDFSTMVLNGLENYFIVNYFGEADYLGTGTAGVPGHIPGAYQFTPNQSLGVDQMLNNLPTDMPIVVYCWTGQHSSQITAFLNMLGYEAYSLKWGSNALFHSDLTAHKWNGTTASYTLEVTPPPMAANF